MSDTRRKQPWARAGGLWTFVFVVWALCLLLGAGVVPAVAQNADTGRPDHLTVVLDNAYPPYVFAGPGGTFQGILIDMWRLWERKTGVPVTLLPMDWNAAQEMLLQGKADVIDMLFYNEERAKHFLFSHPYADVPVEVFVHKDIGGIHDVGSLRGFTVGVKRGDANADFLQTHGVTSLAGFDGYADVVKAAGDDAIKVFCIDKAPGLFYLYKFGLENEYRLAFALYEGQFHRAVRRGNDAVLRFVEDGFAQISHEEREAITRKWIGADLTLPFFRGYGRWILAGVGLAALILLAFNGILRRTVRRQTARLNDLLAAMAQSEERYRLLVQGAGSAILRLDAHGFVSFCNEYARTLFGPSPGDDVVGQPFSRYIEPPNSDFRLALEGFVRNLTAAPPQGLALTRKSVRPSGDEIWIAWAVRAVRDPAGTLVEILCIGNDVTERKRAEEALRVSEERYSLVMRGANDGIWDWDLKTDTVYYSPRYKEIIGYGPDELSSGPRAWADRIHPDDQAFVMRANKRCIDGEADTFAIEYRLRHRDGSYRWILSRAVSLRDASGQVVRMAGTHTDITRRRRDEEALRESQDQLAKIFRLTPVGLCLIDRKNGHILDVNEAFATMFGLSKPGILGHSSLELGLWRHPEEWEAITGALSRDGSVMGREVEMRHASGATLVVLYSAVHNQSYGEPCILAVLVDISERKVMERALVRSRDSAEAANKAKSEFLSTMSHEIRTPMNIILGMVDVLSESELTPSQVHSLKAIKLAGENLLGLLNNILDLSHIESGGLIMEEKICEPAQLAEKIVAMLQPDAGRKGLTLRLDAAACAGERVYCCPDRLRQVLINLVDNAIKFTVQGEVVVTVTPQRKPDMPPRMLYSVRDTGIGIPDDKQAVIFDRFTQAGSPSAPRAGGVGLGLAICKRLVEMMGGGIRVESREGEGATFTVDLPLRTAPLAAHVPTTYPGILQPKGGSVLLVEDNATNAEVMRLMLEGSAFDLTWAPSGQAALEAFRGHPFDIVLMDLEMPDMDGYATTTALRTLEGTLARPHTPIIALTAHAFDAHRQHSLDAGCDDFQVKPIPKAKLLDMLESWMAVRD